MPSEIPYKKMYFHLFNAISDALCALEARNSFDAVQILVAAQQWGEEAYLEGPDEDAR